MGDVSDGRGGRVDLSDASAEERAAWDAYAAACLTCEDCGARQAAGEADILLAERRLRWPVAAVYPAVWPREEPEPSAVGQDVPLTEKEKEWERRFSEEGVRTVMNPNYGRVAKESSPSVAADAHGKENPAESLVSEGKARPIGTFIAPVFAEDDPELTCLLCHSSRPCELSFTTWGTSTSAHGIHRRCFEEHTLRRNMAQRRWRGENAPVDQRQAGAATKAQAPGPSPEGRAVAQGEDSAVSADVRRSFPSACDGDVALIAAFANRYHRAGQLAMRQRAADHVRLGGGSEGIRSLEPEEAQP